MLAKKQKKSGKRISANDYYHCVEMKRIEKERAKNLAKRKRLDELHEENQRIAKEQKEDFRLNFPAFKTPGPEANVPMFSHVFLLDGSKA